MPKPNDAALRAQTEAVVSAFFAALEAMDIAAFVALWADDGVQDMPFAPPGFPNRLDGKAAVQQQYGGLPGAYRAMRFGERIVHPMADPELAVVQYRGEIELAAGGSYNNNYCGIFHVRDGKLQHFTEYFDPLVLARSFGGDDALSQTFSLPPTT